MKQPKKIFTRMLLNNWGGVSHRILEFHEYVNLFCGKSGSGKSTVMDAIQVVLYGSLASGFLNKAADDAKNRRSVLSYLRGEQKDGTANRADQDFCAQVALEILDTGTGITNCAGVCFEVGRGERSIKNHRFFSHSGPLPENGYLTEERIPYSVRQISELVRERSLSPMNRGRGEINRMYPSKEAYLAVLYEALLGYVDGARFQTMEQSAIALKMTNGTGQFIRDYMFPKSREDTIEKISEQMGAYREIREQLGDLEKRIALLEKISGENRKLLKARADQAHTQALLREAEIQGLRQKYGARKEELERLKTQLVEWEKKKELLEREQEEQTAALIETEARLQSGDYGQKKRELAQTEQTIRLLAGNSEEWRRITEGLLRWEQDEAVTDYVSNPARHLIRDFAEGRVSEEACISLKRYLQEAGDAIEEELRRLDQKRLQISSEIREKGEIAEDLRNDRKSYGRNGKRLKRAREKLEERLRTLHPEKNVSVFIFADLFDICQEEWRNPVEGRLGRLKYSLITPPEYADEAAAAFREMKRYQDVDLIHSGDIVREGPQAREGSLFEAVRAEEGYVEACLKRYLGRVMKCRSIEELRRARDGVTPDCYSYSNYLFRHLREQDYTSYACIGTRVSKARLLELEEELEDRKGRLSETVKAYDRLKSYRRFEQLGQEPGQLLALSKASGNLEQSRKRQEELAGELKDLEDGSLVAELRRRQRELQESLSGLRGELQSYHGRIIRQSAAMGEAKSEAAGLGERLERLLEGYAPGPELEEEVRKALKDQSESAYRGKKSRELEGLAREIQDREEARLEARMRFNREYASCGFSGMEKENQVYDQLLEQCRRDYEPKYRQEFQDKCDEVYQSLRDNVISSIHGSIREAHRHKREINRLLAKIQFSDSIYQIDITPSRTETARFYEMLTARELDSKVTDNQGFDGQMSLGEEVFLQKYGEEIQLLTEKFMPPREKDAGARAARKQEMERYADYRNYLTFSMYERVVDEAGNEKKNQVDEMAGRDSGGEGQNPKYVALLAGFAMLYMQQSSRDSRIRLVLLDEAFSKMDKERSEVCLRYARELELQLIVCVPDERLQSLIRNVDCVYGFRRYQNQISMMHIDKGNYLELLEGERERSAGETGKQNEKQEE